MAHPNAHPDAGIYTNAFQVAADIAARGARVAPDATRIVRDETLTLETTVKAHASGRPGPNVITGNYRGSWNSRTAVDGGTIRGQVGTNAPQGRRLEYGFVGADALGRVYNQPPYPHAGPAFQEREPRFREAMGRVLE